MKRLRMFRWVAGIVSLLFVHLAGLNYLAGQTLLDRIVAVVDKEIITESDLQERLNYIAL